MADASQSPELEKLEKELSQDQGAPAPGAKKKGRAKKKKSQGPHVLWTVRVEVQLKEAWSFLAELAQGLRSSDPATRRMSRIFFMNLTGAILVLAFAVQEFRWARHERAVANLQKVESENKTLNRFMERQAEEGRRRNTTLSLGDFTVELKRDPGQKEVSGVINMAELELVAECDSRETCIYLEGYLAQAKSQITDVFTAMDRESLLSREGKGKIKKALIDKLNQWLPSGKIENVYFSKLIIS